MPTSTPSSGLRDHVNVVLFSGGRGSGALSRQLLATERARLALVINGYDDGASTGDVRRLLGDCLGPSDFRKNASNLARALATGPVPLVDLLDRRLPKELAAGAGHDFVVRLADGAVVADAPWQEEWFESWAAVPAPARAAVAQRLRLFLDEESRVAATFPYPDCALGNLIFAGSFLLAGRRFNDGLADYCHLLGVPPDLIHNVTDGTNAFLVAVDDRGRLLASEAEIVAAGSRHKIRDIALVDHEVTPGERADLAGAPVARVEAFLREHATQPALNPRVAQLLAEADFIIYAPGTQHSSLLPSYLTPGVGAAIAGNLRAIKLLVTNLQEDADTADASAVEIIGRAVHYLRNRSRLAIRTPCLISHYLLNDGRSGDGNRPYVPLGRLEALEDPRLVRVANYEDGSSGRHDAKKVLGPFVESLAARPARQRVVVWLVATGSADKVCQTLLEAVRAGLEQLEPALTVLYHATESLDDDFAARMPCPVVNVATPGEPADFSFRTATASIGADYVLLCDSSGMYRGEDLVNIALLLTNRRLDAVWGSRRLSVKDIRASYRERYRNHPLLGHISYLGSHLLSLAYLLRFGRYVSDTLSGIRAVRTVFVLQAGGDPSHPDFNHRLLAALLDAKADLIETPVQFFPISSEIERRTTVRGRAALARPPGDGPLVARVLLGPGGRARLPLARRSAQGARARARRADD